MKKPQLQLLDLMEGDFKKIAPDVSFHRVYQTHLPGRGLIYDICPACEYKEHTVRQHCIAIHLAPEHNSQRRLGDTVEIENPKVGDVAIIPKGVNHWQRIETEQNGGILLSIEAQQLSHFAREIIQPDCVELLPTFAKPDPLIYGIALNLKQVLDSECEDILYVESLFNTLLRHLLRNYCTKRLKPNEVEGLPSYKLKQVLDLIGDCLESEVKVEQLAKQIDLSPFHFVREFKKSVGVTPHQYVMQQRIDRAKRLLKQQLPIAEIALECGFSNQSHLGRVFKRYTGTTPKRYRREFR